MKRFKSRIVGNKSSILPSSTVGIEPGKPAQNAFERFNRTFREDVLDAYLFSTIQEVRDIVDEWLEEYNAIRPHEALGGVPPYQYVLSNA